MNFWVVHEITDPHFNQWKLKAYLIKLKGEGTEITITPKMMDNKTPGKIIYELMIPLLISNVSIEATSKLFKPSTVRILKEKRIL